MSAPTKEDEQPGLDSAEQYLFEYSMFLLTAARGCVTEPHMYGPLRLLDAISRLTELYSRTDKIRADQFLLQAKKQIDDNKNTVMASEEEFVAFMDKMIVEFTRELKRRYSRAQEL
ncbi:MAG: DUF6092 family protein [Thaumarchaeota archaeon]|nr:DUF6092 family protein [Nitrososphaerota archaeon]